MKLAIISHTEHFKLENGTIVGWGSTVNEINHLIEIFDEIYHVAMLDEGVAPKSTLPYSSQRITFVAIPKVGGKTISSKMRIVLNAPTTLRTVSKVLKKVDVFQFRAPTGIGVYVIPYLTLFIKKKGWFKYAGNWNQKNPPLGYGLQRWFLKKQDRKVTINGRWPDQPKHCLTFENPCLTEEDLKLGQTTRSNKPFGNKKSFCFVGRLEKEKGVERIILACNSLSVENKEKIESIHLIGEGPERSFFEELTKGSQLNYIFHGALSRDEVFEIYKNAHFFVLPSSASEGFPKVIAEAMNFGCIPIVSAVSSIDQYISHEVNGFIVNSLEPNCLFKILERALFLSNKEYNRLIKMKPDNKYKFSYDYYCKRLTSELL